MAKKNCRMTDDERAIHDRAVSLLKMTDRQLCDTMDRQHSTGIDEGIRLAAENNAKQKDFIRTNESCCQDLEINLTERRTGCFSSLYRGGNDGGV